MTEFLLAPQNIAFSVALALMLAIAALEGVMTVLGAGLSQFFDQMLPDSLGEADIDLDIDADVGMELDAPDLELADVADVDGDVSPDLVGATGQSGLTRLLGWLCVGRVPVLVMLVVFLTLFGLAGFIIQGAAHDLTGFMFPGWFAWLPALAVSLPAVRLIGRGLARVVPKDESSAVSLDSFVGRVAVITQGVARKDLPAQARLRDRFGKSHYVMVEPDVDGDEFSAGARILLVSREAARFRGITASNPALLKDS